MGKVIFSKCSLERKSQYQIITTITEEEGVRYVSKKAATDLAKSHISSMYAYSCTPPIFLVQGVKLAACRKISDREVEFAYCTGQSLQEVMEGHLSGGQENDFFQDIVLWMDIIRRVAGVKPFALSEGFTQTFGATKLLEGYDAIDGANIDMLAENIYLGGDGEKTIIDYEWIMPFLVPIKYIMFRVLLHNPLINMRKDLQKKAYDIAGISDGEKDLFMVMEEKFQSCIADMSLTKLYQIIGKDRYVVSDNGRVASYNRVKVYDDNHRLLMDESSIQTTIEISLETKDTKNIHVELCDSGCVIKVLESIYLKDDGLHIESSNSILNIYENYYFSEKPVMVFHVEDVDCFYIKYSIMHKNNELIKSFAKTCTELQQLREKNEDNRIWREAYKEKADELEHNLLALGDERGRLEQQLLALGDERGRLEQQLLALGDERNELDRKNSILNEENSKLKNDLDIIRSKKSWNLYAKISGTSKRLGED